MPKRDADLLLIDIINCCNNIDEYVGTYSYDEFINDKKTLDAVIRNFEIIGEASKMISEEIKINNPLIEWRMMSDFRNILIHEYFGIDYEVVWKSIKESIPYNFELLKKITL
jgi:uncharacterized protein with HEPN domain